MIDPSAEEGRQQVITFSREGRSGRRSTVAVPRPPLESQAADVEDDHGYPYDEEDNEGCSRCHGEGGWHDCGEDSCCCGVNAELVNEDWVWCPECHGRG